jgi:hypothetical protein
VGFAEGFDEPSQLVKEIHRGSLFPLNGPLLQPLSEVDRRMAM